MSLCSALRASSLHVVVVAAAVDNDDERSALLLRRCYDAQKCRCNKFSPCELFINCSLVARETSSHLYCSPGGVSYISVTAALLCGRVS